MKKRSQWIAPPMQPVRGRFFLRELTAEDLDRIAQQIALDPPPMLPSKRKSR